jgi:hypothetical protein
MTSSFGFLVAAGSGMFLPIMFLIELEIDAVTSGVVLQLIKRTDMAPANIKVTRDSLFIDIIEFDLKMEVANIL